MLLGRDAERRAIDGMLAAARVGASGVLVLTGEAGVGKTALLDEVAVLAPTMRRLSAQGVESEQAIPFGGLLQLLRPILSLLDDLPGPQSDALSSALMLRASPDREPSRFAVGSATLTLLSRAADEQPLVVLVDDAHLLDRPSADALLFAARRLVSDAVAVLATTRHDAPGSAAWAELPSTVVTGLDLDSAAGLLEVGSGGLNREQVEALHGATAGNPLVMLELRNHPDRFAGLPADCPVPVSEAVSRSFIGRFEELDDDTQLALIVAAADSAHLGNVHRACAALGLPAAPLAKAEDAGLVSLREDQVVFRHPLVRSAVYGAAESETRRLVHRALAKVTPREQGDRFAWHLAEGAVSPDEATAAVLDSVGTHAVARGAYSTASSAHERAAQLSAEPAGTSRRLAQAGQTAWMAGSTSRAISLLDAALVGAFEPSARSWIREVRGAVEFRCGSLVDARDMLVRAADDIGDTDPARTVRLLSDAIHVCSYLGDPATAMSMSARIEALLGRVDDAPSRFLGTMASGMAMILDGCGADSGPRKIREALEMVASGADLGSDPFRLSHRILAVLYLRESGSLRSVIDDAVAGLRDAAALGALPYVLMHVGRDDATTDRWDDAEAAYLEGIRLASETKQTTDFAACQAGLAALYARQGRVAECRELTRSATLLCQRGHIWLGSGWLDFAQGDLAFGLGDLEAALTHYQRLMCSLEQQGVSDPDASPVPELVEALVHLGRFEEAVATTGRFADAAEAKGQPWSLARLERCRALCGSDEQARDHFEAALELHERTPDRYETARTQLAYGSSLRRQRRRLDARPLLAAALSTFEDLGAHPWADRAASELEATGQTAHRRGVDPIDELTPQERQIAQLLAAGRTTREAAAALFISPKTVEYHLRHVYLKLDLNSREALAVAFGR